MAEATAIPWSMLGSVTGSDLRVFIAIDKLQQTTGNPSIAAICAETGLVGTTILRAVARMEAAGVLVKEHRRAITGANLSNTYRLVTANGEPIAV